MLRRPVLYFPFFMWSIPLVFFAYQFILRLWPGLMMPQIMHQFNIGAADFGILAAFYYYGYAGMQIPVAMLLDRFSPRYILFIFASICGMATLVFTYTDTFFFAVLSRFFIGAGSAVGFLGVSKVVSQWFPQVHYARMIGFSFSFGLMGAIYGGKPISLLMQTYTWQDLALVLAMIAVFIGILAYLFLSVPAAIENDTVKNAFSLQHFKTTFTSPLIWCLAIANLLMVGSLEGFSDVWGVPYLMTAYGLSKADAAGLISFVFFGMLFGGPLLAFCSKKIGNYTVISLAGFGMALAFWILLSKQNYDTFVLSVLFFLVGILCCYQVIIFAAGSTLVAPENLGVTVAFLNCINMLGGSFFHTIIGKIMDVSWAGGVSGSGTHLYSLSAYQYALATIPICAVLGASMVVIIAYYLKRSG